jgi:uncharacterized protein DUF6151
MAGPAQTDTPLEFSCSCGQLQGHIVGKAVAHGTHVECYCRDCRAGQLYLEKPDPAPGPVDLFLTTPDKVTITKGAEFLAPFRLSPRGPLRWRATCCNTGLCTTGTGPKVPFAGFQTATFANTDHIGPVIAKTYMPKIDGKTTNQGMMRMIVRFLPQILATRLSGRWQNTPFFNAETGAPVVDPTVLSKQQRAGLYPVQRKTSG